MSESIFKRMGSVIATKLDTLKTDLETQIELSKYTLPAATDTTLGGVKINNVTHTINAGVLTLTASGASAGTYGSATNIPVLSVDTHGRVTGISTVAVSIPSGSISVTGGDLTMSGTTGVAITNATLVNSGVTAGTYKSVTVDVKGRVTAGTNPTTLTGYGITDGFSIAGGSLSGRVDLKTYTESKPFITASPTINLDLTTGTCFDITLTSNTTFTFSNCPNVANTMFSFTLVVRQDATGSRTAIFPANRPQGGTALSLTTTANKADIISWMTTDGGTTWFTSIAKNY